MVRSRRLLARHRRRSWKSGGDRVRAPSSLAKDQLPAWASSGAAASGGFGCGRVERTAGSDHRRDELARSERLANEAVGAALEDTGLERVRPAHREDAYGGNL